MCRWSPVQGIQRPRKHNSPTVRDTLHFHCAQGSVFAAVVSLNVCFRAALRFDSEVCQRSGQYPQDGVREIRDCSDDLYLPQCERYSCDGFWSNFSECSEKCPAHGDGGVVTRTLVVPFNDTFATRFYTEMCEGKPFVISGTRAVYPNLPGGQQTLGCDHVAPTLGGGFVLCRHAWIDWQMTGLLTGKRCMWQASSV